MNTELIEQNVHRLLGAMTGAATTAMVAVGDLLGLYRALADEGPATPEELADRTGTAVRYVREWLSQQAAAGLIVYQDENARYTLPAEAAAVLAYDASPAFMAGGATITRGWFAGIDRLAAAFRTGAGIPWHEQDVAVFDGTELESLDATSYPAFGFDLICMLDTLHDLGDPAAALAHARKALAPDGTVLIVEPNAADDYAANLANPLAALSYAASTFPCTPAALAQSGGVALGAQAGPAAVRELAAAAGFSQSRQVTETPVNVVLELRP